MRISELLINTPKVDKTLLSKSKIIDNLRSQVHYYIDHILDPKATKVAKDFLKTQLRTNFIKLKDEFGSLLEDEDMVQYEIFDMKDQKVVKKGPYNRKSARMIVDRMDNAYGAYRYKYRPIGKIEPLSEAIRKLPLSDEDFKIVKELMENPIPAAIAPIYISEIIDDDELNDTLLELEETKPNMDIRPIIASWIDRVMPDQKYRFTGDGIDNTNPARQGLKSPISGYDSKFYKGSSDSATPGNAYGRY